MHEAGMRTYTKAARDSGNYPGRHCDGLEAGRYLSRGRPRMILRVNEPRRVAMMHIFIYRLRASFAPNIGVPDFKSGMGFKMPRYRKVAYFPEAERQGCINNQTFQGFIRSTNIQWSYLSTARCI